MPSCGFHSHSRYSICIQGIIVKYSGNYYVVHREFLWQKVRFSVCLTSQQVPANKRTKKTYLRQAVSPGPNHGIFADHHREIMKLLIYILQHEVNLKVNKIIFIWKKNEDTCNNFHSFIAAHKFHLSTGFLQVI